VSPAARYTLLGLVALLALQAGAEPALPRVVSLNPSLTAIVIALDARAALVGIDDYSARANPEVAALPRVGGLFDPSLEAIVALEPDLVVLVPSAEQRDLRARLEALGCEVLALENITLEQGLASIEALGARVGRVEAARERVAAIRRAFAEAARATGARPPVRAVLVLQREPLFVVGSGSYLDEMLRAAGARNLAAEFGEAYPRLDVEWLIAAAPDLILDASDEALPPQEYWSRWPSLPAVAKRRAVALPAPLVTLPGPYLDRAVEILAAAVSAAAAPSPPATEARP
jgi:iron complex transport system substrate-binding protein